MASKKKKQPKRDAVLDETPSMHQRLLDTRLTALYQQPDADADGGQYRRTRQRDFVRQALASAEGSVRAKEAVGERRERLTALLVAAMKRLGYQHPGQYFKGETFQYDDACARLLGALPEEVESFLMDKRPGRKRPGRPRLDANEGALTLRTLKKRTARLKNWTRTERDRECEEAAVEPAAAKAEAHRWYQQEAPKRRARRDALVDEVRRKMEAEEQAQAKRKRTAEK